MNIKNMRWAAVAASCFMAGWVVPAMALFGMGEKKSSTPAQTTGAPSGKDGSGKSLPGMGDSVGDSGKAAASNDASAANKDASDSSQQAKQDSGGSDQPNLPGTGTTPSGGTNLPSEVVIKGNNGAAIRNNKPPLALEMDAFESIRPSLQPDESLLLAESPYAVSWRRTYPEFLNNSRLIQPWRTTFSEKPGIVFNVREQLFEAAMRNLDPKEIRDYQWSLTIADEEGRVFQHYEGSKDPPAELIWSGQNDQNEWIKPGRSYSAVYTFTDPGGSPHTRVGKPLQLTGVVHQEQDGMHISLDAGALFGANKSGEAIEKGGLDLMHAAADHIKRRFTGIPVKVQVLSATKESGETQAGAVQDYLVKDLMLLPQNITTEGAHAPFSEQRVEIVLQNR